jgi:MerR family copper efflux transcriptional regulator
VGLSASAIRYYEEIGLLPPSSRSQTGYRLYSQDDLARLRFVKRARLLDLSLDEITDIVAYAMDGRCSPLQHHLSSMLEAKVAEVDERIRELCRLREDLGAYHQILAQQTSIPATGESSTNQAFCQCLDGPQSFDQSSGPSCMNLAGARET